MKKHFLPLLLPAVAAFCFLAAGTPAVRAQGDTQRFSTSINGATISYTVTGSSTGGDTIVLIHGYPLNANLFVRQRKSLGRSYRVVTVDLRGFGESVAPDADASIDVYANDVLALLDQLNIQQAIIGGHSLGGAVTLRLYQLAPSRFLGMILNDSASFPPMIAEQYMWAGYAEQTMAMGSGVTFLPMLLPSFLTGATRTTRPAVVGQLADLIRAASVNGLIGGARALQNRPDLTVVFQAITVPTLILYGQEDPLTPIEQANLTQGAIKGSTLVIVPGASHGVIREKAAVADAAILSWLGANFGSGTAQAAAAGK